MRVNYGETQKMLSLHLITLSPEVILQLEAQAPALHDICCEARGLQREGESVGRVVCRDRPCHHVTDCLELC